MLQIPTDVDINPLTSSRSLDDVSIHPRTRSEAVSLVNHEVEIIGETSINGVSVLTARVYDEYLDPSESHMRHYIQDVISGLEQTLRSDDPEVVSRGVQDGLELLDSSPTIRAWKELMTTAMALYPLQRPTAGALLDGTPVDSFARDLFLHGQDAIGIRDRGALFSHLLRERDGSVQNVLSLASGAAVPECDAIRTMTAKPRAIFVDMDTRALGHVKRVAAEAGLENDAYKLVEANLVKDFMFASDPRTILPDAEKSFDVIDALGITEYFKDRHMKRLLETAYRLVRPGGALIFGNMLDTHPTLNFNQQIVEWPGVNPRSRETLASIAAEISGAKNVQMYIPESGVYAVVKMEKPAVAAQVRPLGSVALVR